MSGVMHIIDDSVIKSGVARPLKVSDLSSSGGGGASGETTTTVSYTLLNAWAGLPIGSTVYWVQTDTEGADPTFKWLKSDGTEIAAPPDATYYSPSFDTSTFAHTHLQDANGVVFYYVSRPGAASVAYKVSDGAIYAPVGVIKQVLSEVVEAYGSDGVALPISSLAVAYGGVSPGTVGSWTQTVVYKGNTYVKTIVFNSKGDLSSQSGWVKQ